MNATVKELPKALPRCLISIAKLKAENSFQHVTNKTMQLCTENNVQWKVNTPRFNTITDMTSNNHRGGKSEGYLSKT